MLAALVLFMILITPVTLRLDVRCGQAAEALLAPRFWGLGPSLRFRLEKTDQGRQVFRVDKSGRLKPLKASSGSSVRPAMALLRAALRGNLARQLLLRGVSLQRLDVALNVSLDNAARTALTAGGLQSLWRALPCSWRRKARLRVRPDFLGGQSSAQARCMVFFRLGTLFLTAAMLLLSYFMERAAHPVQPAKEA